MSGWVKLHRSILKWEWWDCPKTFRFFTWCLLKASHNEYKWKGKTFKAGEFPMGLSEASKELKLSMQEIRTCIKRLISTNELTKKSNSQGTVLTIVNWEKYQQSTNELTNEQQTSNKRATTTKNEKNEKNEKKLLKQPAIFEIDPDFKLTDDDLEAKYVAERIRPAKQKEFLEKWDAAYLKDQFLKAYGYYSDSLSREKFNRKNWLSTMTSWIGRDRNAVENQNKLEAEFLEFIKPDENTRYIDA